MKRSRVPTIRSKLVLLVMACIVPAALIATGLISYGYYQAREQLVRDAIATARAVTSAIDRDFASTESTLLTLATSPYLTSDDLAEFYAQAQDVVRKQAIYNIVLSDVSGKAYLNTMVPFGELLPQHGNSAHLERIATTGNTVVSDVFVGGVAKRPIVAIGVPIYRSGKQTYILDAGVKPERLLTLLNQENFPSDWIVGIFDSNGTIVARTHEMKRYFGAKGAPDLIREMAQAYEGAFEGTTSEGIHVLAVYSRSSISDWTVAIGIPTESLTSELRHTFLLLILITGVLLACSLAVAWFVARQIAGAIHGLTGPALALGSGEVVTIPALGLREADEVGVALMCAYRMLRQAQYQANHDGLTGLANRALFKELVNQQLPLCHRNGTRLSILYIDLDGFKAVNDEHGHAAGDRLLRMVAVRIKAGIRESDAAARLGGDEFAVLLMGACVEEAAQVAANLVNDLSAPYTFDDLKVEISASIGVAGFPDDGTNSKALLQHADEAMYKAKVLGKRQVVVAKNRSAAYFAREEW